MLDDSTDPILSNVRRIGLFNSRNDRVKVHNISCVITVLSSGVSLNCVVVMSCLVMMMDSVHYILVKASAEHFVVSVRESPDRIHCLGIMNV